MCGIFGYIGKHRKERERVVAHELLLMLALTHQERGVDAAGFALLTMQGQLVWKRQVGPARELYLSKAYAQTLNLPVSLAVGHTRQASSGAPARNGNNHPHIAGAWSIVHNGHIPFHKKDAERHSIELHSECDSELIAALLAKYGKGKGVKAALDCGGSQSVLALDRKRKRLVVWTNGRMPLTTFKVTGVPGVFFASTKLLAEKALAFVGLKGSAFEPVPRYTTCEYTLDGTKVRVRRQQVAVTQQLSWSGGLKSGYTTTPAFLHSEPARERSRRGYRAAVEVMPKPSDELVWRRGWAPAKEEPTPLNSDTPPEGYGIPGTTAPEVARVELPATGRLTKEERKAMLNIAIQEGLLDDDAVIHVDGWTEDDWEALAELLDNDGLAAFSD